MISPNKIFKTSNDYVHIDKAKYHNREMVWLPFQKLNEFLSSDFLYRKIFYLNALFGQVVIVLILKLNFLVLFSQTFSELNVNFAFLLYTKADKILVE